MGNESIINKPDYYIPQKYFSDYILNHNNNKIQFNLSIDNCELNVEYSCEIYLNSDKENDKIERTEKKICLDNENKKISFSNTKAIVYTFDKIQNIYIKVFKNENKTSIINTTIGELLVEKIQHFQLKYFKTQKKFYQLKQ